MGRERGGRGARREGGKQEITQCCFVICSDESLDTDTCRVMDNVAQYMSIFFANLQHKIGRATVCMAVHSPASLCNTVRCTAPSVNSTFSLLPCSDPIGLTGGYGSSDGSWSNYTLYSSGVVNISADMYVEVTLDQVAPHVVGMAVSCCLLLFLLFVVVLGGGSVGRGTHPFPSLPLTLPLLPLPLPFTPSLHPFPSPLLFSPTPSPPPTLPLAPHPMATPGLSSLTVLYGSSCCGR